MPGLLIKKHREAKGISQEQMAQMLHMSQSNYSKIENNKVAMTVIQARKIAKALDLTIDDILPDETVIESAAHFQNNGRQGLNVETIDALFNQKFDELKTWLSDKLGKSNK